MKRGLWIILGAGLFMYKASAQKQGLTGPVSEIRVEQTKDIGLSRTIGNAFGSLNVDTRTVMTNTGLSSFNSGDFDFTNLYKTYTGNDGSYAIIAPYRSWTRAGDFAFVVFVNQGTVFKSMVLKGVRELSAITYYDLDEGRSLTVGSNSGTFYSRNTGGENTISANRRGGCGQAVMDCINDAYTSHGWFSVWAWIQSAFIPATAAGIAISCVERNCLR